MRQTALIVDEDPVIRRGLASTLANAGIDSTQADNAASMWLRLEENPDIVILDINLPDIGGLELLRQLRGVSAIPVLIHAVAADENERIATLEYGADDFLTKPCNMRELVARSRGLLRRPPSRPPSSGGLPALQFGNWKLDRASRELRHNGGEQIALGGSAYALLTKFVEHPFELLSREQLSRVLKREYMPYDRIVDVHVSQIRRILGRQADGQSFIKTQRSLGYIFIATVNEAF